MNLVRIAGEYAEVFEVIKGDYLLFTFRLVFLFRNTI